MSEPIEFKVLPGHFHEAAEYAIASGSDHRCWRCILAVAAKEAGFPVWIGFTSLGDQYTAGWINDMLLGLYVADEVGQKIAKLFDSINFGFKDGSDSLAKHYATQQTELLSLLPATVRLIPRTLT
jgi:hypothetical protein